MRRIEDANLACIESARALYMGFRLVGRAVPFMRTWLMTVLAISILLPASGNAAEAKKSLTPFQSDVVYENYVLRNGEKLDHLRLHYATLGKPHYDSSREIDNAVLVLHHTGSSGGDMLTPEYIETLFAEGRPLDANRYYLIFPDNLGHGKSTKPSDGLEARFPHYGYNDLVDLQHKLVVENLGIKRLQAILGVSMGGMNAWQWAESYPDEVKGIMPVVSLPDKVSGRNLLWRRLAIFYIRNDPAWRDGKYRQASLGFSEAYLLLRMMIDGVPHLQSKIPDSVAAEEFITTIVNGTEGADPNDLLYSLESSKDYDPSPALEQIKAKTYALNFSDDEFNPDVLSILETQIRRVKDARYFVQQGSSSTYGHYTMTHPALWADHVREFLNWLESPR